MNEILKLGQRVIHPTAGLGNVESVDGKYCDIRLLTPHNTPSCVVTLVTLQDLIPVEDNVIPMPRNRAWYRESEAFCSAIASFIEEEL